jgi:hypothetical protein
MSIFERVTNILAQPKQIFQFFCVLAPRFKSLFSKKKVKFMGQRMDLHLTKLTASMSTGASCKIITISIRVKCIQDIDLPVYSISKMQ